MLPTPSPSVRPTRSSLALVLAVAAVLPAVASGCNQQTSAADAETATGGVKEREIPPVDQTEVEQREMVHVLETTSKLESEREVSLFPRLPGTAIEVLAEEGDVVDQGTVLARLENRDELLAARDAEVAVQEANDRLLLAELAVEEAIAEIDSVAKTARQAERDFERDQRLFDSSDVANPLSKQALESRLLERDNAQHAEEQAKIIHRRRKLEVEQAKTALARAELAAEVAQENLSKKELVAPFDGVIALRNIRVGDNVGTAEAAFVLTDTENLRAVFARPQEELAMFSRLGATGEGGLTIRATAEAYPGASFVGYVERISPTIEADSGQFRVTARLATETGSEARLLPGMLVRMRIITERHANALVVPKRSMRREGERRYVLKLEDVEGTEAVVRMVNVDEGFEDDDSVEVVPLQNGALAAGDRIVLVGSRDLIDGDTVRIENAGEDGETAEEIPEVEVAGEPDSADDPE